MTFDEIVGIIRTGPSLCCAEQEDYELAVKELALRLQKYFLQAIRIVPKYD